MIGARRGHSAAADGWGFALCMRSREVIALNREDVLFPEAQIHVRGKGDKTRFLPLAPEAIQLLDHYLRLERPNVATPPLFVSLKGRARGARITPAGLRSLFRYHRRTTGVQKANPHRFRHTFATDMVRAGVSLPALMRLMGHASIHTRLCPRRSNSARCLSAICSGRRPTCPPDTGDAAVTPSRRAPFAHPLAMLFDDAVDSLGAALAPASTRQYRSTARGFLLWLGAHHPEAIALDQLRRDPHILGWMAALRSRVPLLAPVTYILRLIFLRGVLSELAWTAKLPELGQLLRRQDIPRR